jgi:hypothetical protein
MYSLSYNLEMQNVSITFKLHRNIFRDIWELSLKQLLLNYKELILLRRNEIASVVYTE